MGGMIHRKLLIALTAAALYAVVLVTAASAELRQVRVTLVTGQTLTMTVDVPPGTAVQQLQIPGLPAPVQEIVDLGPVSTATPTPTPTVTVTPEAATPTPTATPGNQQGGGGSGGTKNKGGGGKGSGGGEGSTHPEDAPANEGAG